MASKSGSRGKIQQRCCQGRMASSLSHRQRVVSLREAASPQERTWAPSSATLQRERGSPTRLGNSQAIALTCTTSSGGKNPGPARAFEVFQPGQSFFEEPFSPAADDFASGAEPVGDLIIGEALLGEENHLGAGNHKIRQRIFIGAPLQLFSFLLGEHDRVRAFPWQIDALPATV